VDGAPDHFSNFIFIVSRVEVCHEQDLVFIPIKNEGERAMTSVIIIVLDFN
jgi:hypothetical protein